MKACNVLMTWSCYESYVDSHNLGGFHVVTKIIRELKSHMIPYKFKCSHWWKIALQSECCNFNQ